MNTSAKYKKQQEDIYGNLFNTFYHTNNSMFYYRFKWCTRASF